MRLFFQVSFLKKGKKKSFVREHKVIAGVMYLIHFFRRFKNCSCWQTAVVKCWYGKVVHLWDDKSLHCSTLDHSNVDYFSITTCVAQAGVAQ